jgi:hypothetical protein
VFGGLFLILLGALFLFFQLMPGLRIQLSWPWIIVGVGAFLLVLGLLVGAPGMAIPACIVGGIGGLLYYQFVTGDWESWAYAWSLIPGFVGVGMILAGLLGEDTREMFSGGSWLILISLVLFVVFGSFLGGPKLLGDYWPVLLIALGLLQLVRALFRRR